MQCGRVGVMPAICPGDIFPDVTMRDWQLVIEASLPNIIIITALVSLGQFVLSDGISVLLPIRGYRGGGGSLWAMIAID